jgi:hypothetical protein
MGAPFFAAVVFTDEAGHRFLQPVKVLTDPADEGLSLGFD